jgi:hypothetical protein
MERQLRSTVVQILFVAVALIAISAVNVASGCVREAHSSFRTFHSRSKRTLYFVEELARND